MGFFDLFKSPDINQGISRFQSVKRRCFAGCVHRGEYAQGHIPKSRNLPLQELHKAPSAIPGRDTPLFVYCLSEPEAARRFPSFRKWGIQM